MGSLPSLVRPRGRGGTGWTLVLPPPTLLLVDNPAPSPKDAARLIPRVVRLRRWLVSRDGGFPSCDNGPYGLRSVGGVVLLPWRPIPLVVWRPEGPPLLPYCRGYIRKLPVVVARADLALLWAVICRRLRPLPNSGWLWPWLWICFLGLPMVVFHPSLILGRSVGVWWWISTPFDLRYWIKVFTTVALVVFLSPSWWSACCRPSSIWSLTSSGCLS